MAKGKVVWTATAASQRMAILKYWALRNKSSLYSRKLIQLIKSRIKTLLKYPQSGSKTSIPGLQVASLGHFSIVYKIENPNIVIIAFWDNRQNPTKLLNILASQVEIAISIDEIILLERLLKIQSYQELHADLQNVLPDISEVLAELVEKNWVQQMHWSSDAQDFVKKEPPDLQQLDLFHYLATKEGLMAVNIQ